MVPTRLKRTARSNGGIWATLAEGPLVSTALEAASDGETGAISVRLRRAAGSAFIVPFDELPGGAGARIRTHMLPVMAGDTLEVRSEAPVNWFLEGVALISPRQYSAIATTSGNTWTTIVDAAGQAVALTAANRSYGDAEVSVRILGSNAATVLVPPELIPMGGSRRKVPVTTLAAGEVLQVKSSGLVDWIASGVNAP